MNDGQLDIEPAIGGGYITVDGLRMAYSKCRGIIAKAVGSSGMGDGDIQELRIENTMTEYTGFHPMVLESGAAKNCVIRGGIHRYFNMCENSAREGGTDAGGAGNCGLEPSGWPGGISLNRNDDARCLIEDNSVYLGRGETYNVLSTGNVVVRGNRGGNQHSGCIYADNTRDGQVVIESNICWYTQDDDVGAGPGTHSNWLSGMPGNYNMENSAFGRAEGTVYAKGTTRNNLCVGCSGIFASIGTDAAAAGLDLEQYVLGNTGIGRDNVGTASRKMDVWNNFGASNFGFFRAYSNLQYMPSSSFTSADRCRGQVETAYNTWDAALTDSDCYSTSRNDQAVADPDFDLTPYTLFDAFDWANQPDVDDFRLNSTSTVLNDGDDSLLTASCDIGTWVDDLVNNEMTYPFTPVLATWKNCLAYDFEGTLRTTLNNNPGALVGSVP